MDGMLLPMNFRETAIALQSNLNIRAAVPSVGEELPSTADPKSAGSHFPRGIPAFGRLRQCAFDVSVKLNHRKRAPIPPYKIPRNNGGGVGWNRCALSAFVSRTALPHTGVACRRQEFHVYKGTGNLGAVGLVPRSTLFCGSEPTKRAKTALQPLEIIHYSLRATPCLDAPGEL